MAKTQSETKAAGRDLKQITIFLYDFCFTPCNHLRFGISLAFIDLATPNTADDAGRERFSRIDADVEPVSLAGIVHESGRDCEPEHRKEIGSSPWWDEDRHQVL